MKNKIIILKTGLFLSSLSVLLSGCQDNINSEESSYKTVLNIDAASDTYNLSHNNKQGTWELTSYPEWATPVDSCGNVQTDLKIYFESNGRGEDRSGELEITYNDGSKQKVQVNQSRANESFHLERAQGVGWGMDVGSYMDSRGLTDQIFNTEKIRAFNKNAVTYSVGNKLSILYFQGESIDKVQQSLTASLNLNVKISAFDATLNGAFDKTSMKDSQRYFSWMRGTFQKKQVTMHIDVTDAQRNNLFTHDFAIMRQRVIDSEGSEEAIRELIERYGTHYIWNAGLGGYIDYFYSFVQSMESDKMNIKAALQCSYEKKFGLKATVEYNTAFEAANSEKIEKFFVRGGDAMTLTNCVASGNIGEQPVTAWQTKLEKDDQFELITFSLRSISSLFPNDAPTRIATKIDDYISRVLYYNNLPLTRSEKKR